MSACGDKAGTLAGMSRHRRAWDPACEACKKAAADYQRTRRQSSDDLAAQARAESARRHWALKTLARKHPAQLTDQGARQRRRSPASRAGVAAAARRGGGVMTCKPYVYTTADEFHAFCPQCLWEAEPSTNYTVARVRADAHRNQGEN